MRIIFIVAGILMVIAVAVLLTVKMLQMDSNLSASIHLTQNLKTQVGTLWKENFDYREQLRTFTSKNEELEKAKSRLASQLEETRSKQAYLERVAMDQTTRVKELEGVSESLDARDTELSQKDEQLRALTQELEMMRLSAKDVSPENGQPMQTGSTRSAREVLAEKSVMSLWNSRAGRTEETDISGMTDNEVREKLSAAILDLRRDEKQGTPPDAGLMADMFYNLGVVSTHHGDYKQAVESFSASLALRSEDADCHYNLAVVYDEKLHDDAMALQHYREYLRLEPNTPELLKIRKWIIDKEAAVMVHGG